MKVVINTCHGGFGLSDAAVMRYANLAGIDLVGEDSSWGRQYYHNGDYWNYCGIERNDPLLVQVVEELGAAANDKYADLKVVEIPDGIAWYVDEYDGDEWVAEQHRTWR